jgi:lipopolysaccharide export system permease protein
MRVLDRYIVLALARAIALALAVLLVLMALFLYVNEQGWVGAGHYGQLQALRYVLMQLPATALMFLPVAALLGALLAMGQLARDSELTVMRASGVSMARIAGSVALAGMLLLLPALAVAEWIAPDLAQAARVNRALERNEGLGLSGGAAWTRDGSRLLRVETDGRITAFELDGPQQLASVAMAASAREAEAGWELSGVAGSRFAPDQVSALPADVLLVPVTVDPDLFGLVRSEPRLQSLSGLQRTIRLLAANGQDASRQRFALWSGVARLVAIPLAMLLAVPLLLGFLRTAGGGARATLGLVVGLLYFLAQRMVENGSQVFGLDPLLLAWLPTLMLGAAVALLLWRVRRASVA